MSNKDEDNLAVLEKKADLLCAYLQVHNVEFMKKQLLHTWIIILKFKHYAHYRMDVSKIEITPEFCDNIKMMNEKAMELGKAEEIFRTLIENS
jgi:hypothetical protein